MTLARDILKGLHDHELDSLRTAVVERGRMKQRLKASLVLTEVKVGDTIRITNNIRPSYLLGQLATVTGKRDTRLEIQLSRPTGRFRNGGLVTVPAECVEVIPVQNKASSNE